MHTKFKNSLVWGLIVGLAIGIVIAVTVAGFLIRNAN